MLLLITKCFKHCKRTVSGYQDFTCVLHYYCIYISYPLYNIFSTSSSLHLCEIGEKEVKGK